MRKNRALSGMGHECAVVAIATASVMRSSCATRAIPVTRCAPASDRWDRLWNTRYLERAVAALRQTEDIPDHLLAPLFPLGWPHVDLTGDDVWGGPAEPCRKTPTD